MWNSRATVPQNSRIQALEFPTELDIPSYPTTLALSSPTPFLSPLPTPLTASEAKTETQLYTTLISIHYDLGDKGTRNAIHSEHIINSARNTWELVVERRIFANHIFPNVQAHRLLDWIKNLIWTFLEDFLLLIISLYQVLALIFLNFVLQKGNRLSIRSWIQRRVKCPSIRFESTKTNSLLQIIGLGQSCLSSKAARHFKWARSVGAYAKRTAGILEEVTTSSTESKRGLSLFEHLRTGCGWVILHVLCR